MSIAVMTEVWKDAPVSGTELLMLLALADSANDDRECWPSQKHLQHKVRISKSQAVKVLQSLERQGLIVIHQKQGKGKPGMETNLYTINAMTGIAHDTTPGIAHDTTPGIAHDTLNHHIESSIEPFASGDAKKPKVSKNTVASELMNPMKDAIAAAFRYDWAKMTKSEIGCVQKAAKELIQAAMTPADIPALYAYCAVRFTSGFKAMALPGNVSEWRKAQPAAPKATEFDLSKWVSRDSLTFLENEKA